MRKKVHITRANARLNAYRIIQRAVDEGSTYGVQRAFKHTDTPSRDHIAEQVAEHVMDALSDSIKWEDT